MVLTPAAGQLPPGFRTLLEQQILGVPGVNGRAVVAGVLQGEAPGVRGWGCPNQTQPAPASPHCCRQQPAGRRADWSWAGVKGEERWGFSTNVLMWVVVVS